MVKTKLLLFNREIDHLVETGWEYIITYAKEGFYVVEVDIPRKELAKSKRRMKSRPNIFEGDETMR